MNLVNIDGFPVQGKSVRTNNSMEATTSGKIPGLWQDFFSSHPNSESPIYGVYSEYESDADGDYTVTAGTLADSPLGTKVESGTYLEFPASGEMPGAVVAAWKAVWQHFSSDNSYARLYQTDFEKYTGPQSASIYIGVRASS